MLKSSSIRFREFARRCKKVLAVWCLSPFVLISRFYYRVRYLYILKEKSLLVRHRRLKVMFLVASTSKWKCQSLYEEMARSDIFDPYVALTANGENELRPIEEIEQKLHADELFFECFKDRCIRAYDVLNRKAIPLRKLGADIVFYQEPGFILPEHSVANTSRYALCCYVPYGIDMIGKHIWIHNVPWFHQMMFAWFLDNEMDVGFVKEVCPSWRRSGALVPSGNPILDEYAKGDAQDDGCNGNGYVIYAPHFSIPVDGYPRVLTLSSFLDNGREILKYAKEHPQFNWLFKPHPHLRDELVSRGVWTKEEVDDYYSEWERLGKGWYGGDYIRLFKASRALITDCGSFMAEYPITGKPLIHLISSKLDFPIREQYKEMVASFYSVHNNDELHEVLNMVLEKGEDPKCNERITAVKKTGLMNPDASGRIVSYLSNCLGV